MNSILILFLVTLSTIFTYGQSNETDAQIQFQSFQDVLKYANVYAIQIQSAVIGEQIAAANKKDAKFYLYPSVNASAGYNNNLTTTKPIGNLREFLELGATKHLRIAFVGPSISKKCLPRSCLLLLKCQRNKFMRIHYSNFNSYPHKSS
jgi:hypothetical protein